MNCSTSDNNLIIERGINSKIKTSIIKQLILIFMLGVILLVFLPQFSFNEGKYLLCLSWIGNITFAISIYLYYKATNSFICPYIFFFFSFYCFQFGQWFLYSLGIKYDYIHLGFYATLWDNNSKILVNGTVMIIFSIALFNLGVLCSLLNKNTKKNLLLSFSMSPVSNKAIKTSGWILFLVTIIPCIYNRINEMGISIQYGYAGIYLYSNNKQSVIDSLDILFIPSCILLLISYKNNRIIKNIVQLIMLIIGFIWLIGGGRTEGISILIVLILYNVIFSKKINFKKMLKFLIGAILVMTLVATFSDFRGMKNKNGNGFASVLIENISSKNPIFSTIGEMGWSMGTVFMTMEIVPSCVQYDYGKSYFASLSRFIPTSIDVTGTINELHQQSYEASEMITNFYNLGFGMDTTLVSESYYNFGYYGVIAIFLIGLIIGKILGYTSKSYIINNDMVLYIKLAGVYSIFTLPRRHFGYLINQLAYVIFGVVLMVIFVRSLYNKKQLLK